MTGTNQRQAAKVLLGAIGALTLSLSVSAHEFPGVVQSDANGCFSYEVVYVPESVPDFPWTISSTCSNVDWQYCWFFGDWCIFWPTGCYVGDPSEQCPWVIEGPYLVELVEGCLIDPASPGTVTIDFNACFGSLLADTLILPPGVSTPTPTPTPTSTATPMPPLVIDIDIKPGSDTNSINLASSGAVPVAILGSDSFDVEDVDVTTLSFGPAGALPKHDLTQPNTFRQHHVRVNGDRWKDLISHYTVGETGIAAGDVQACLTGRTLDGTRFEGCDAVRTLSRGSSRRR